MINERDGGKISTPRRIVVIGCSGTGALAAMTLKKLQPDLDVTILREPDEEGLLTRCATPYICRGNVMPVPLRRQRSYRVSALGYRQAGARPVAPECRHCGPCDCKEYSWRKRRVSELDQQFRDQVFRQVYCGLRAHQTTGCYDRDDPGLDRSRLRQADSCAATAEMTRAILSAPQRGGKHGSRDTRN
jgi:glycine/D-amino acid oxidase-like deaminating enzyme